MNRWKVRRVGFAYQIYDETTGVEAAISVSAKRAQLVAAAPELLSALRLAIENNDEWRGRPEAVQLSARFENDDDESFNPDWVVTPWSMIEERLNLRAQEAGVCEPILQQDLDALGLTEADVKSFQTGDAAITPAFAVKLQEVFEQPAAGFWLRLEWHFREGLAHGRKAC